MKNWERFEKDLARKTKGRRSPGSGNGRIKGDINTKDFCIEAKETSKDYINLKTIWLHKIYKEAKDKNKLPIFAINFFGNKTIFLILDNINSALLDLIDLTNIQTKRVTYKDLLSSVIRTGNIQWRQEELDNILTNYRMEMEED